jgi:hypothetical protein
MDEFEDERTTSQSLSILNMVFGAWLVVSPYLLGYSTSQAKWQQTFAGLVVLILAGLRFMATQWQWLSWLNAFVGIWMIIAPFTTGYQSTVAFWNEVILGILVALSGLWNASIHTPLPIQRHQHHRGH